MFTYDEYINYHCPRWEELPDIGLYMDQVVGVLEKRLLRHRPHRLLLHRT